jgi:beta-glucosidase
MVIINQLVAVAATISQKIFHLESKLPQHGSFLVTEDSHFFGQSEPVYPSPRGNGVGDWLDAYAKAQALVAEMTLDEKVGLTSGVRTTSNGCGGIISAVPRLGFPGLCLQDGTNGVRGTDYVNAYPAAIHVGAR